MKDQHYRNYCKLQEQIRSIGFSQEFDPIIREFVQLREEQYFAIPFVVFEQPSDKRTWYQLNFYKLDGSDDFTLDYYHGRYRQHMPIPNMKVCGINISGLEDRMRMIDWNTLTQTQESRGVFKATKHQLRDIVLGIGEDLLALDATPEGTSWRLFLEAKYLSDTPEIEKTPTQAIYDLINSRFTTTYTVPLRGEMVISKQQLDAIWANDLPLPDPLTRKHEIYRVETDGFKVRKGDEVGAFDNFEQEHFFSSLEKAVGFIQKVAPGNFQPINMVFGGEDLYTRMAIYDDVENKFIASKVGNWNATSALSLEGNIIQWVLNDQQISLEQFEQKSGFRLSKYGNPPNKPNVFQVFPKIDPRLDQNEEQKNRFQKRPRTNRNRGKGI